VRRIGTKPARFFAQAARLGQTGPNLQFDAADSRIPPSALAKPCRPIGE